MEIVRLKFYGYTWEDYAFQISSLRGLFVIYKGQLDSEGSIILQEILYIGYHNGIYEMYDNGCMTRIKDFVKIGERIFMSYAEVPECVNGRDVEAFLKKMIITRFANDNYITELSMNISCEGSCALFPQELLSNSVE